MGPPRNCKQKSETKKSNKSENTASKNILKRKKPDTAKETVSQNSQNVPSNNISFLKYLNNVSCGDYFNPAIKKIGPGGSIVGLKFSLDNESSVYTASITGKIRLEHFHNGIGKTLLSTFCFKNWFFSLDVSRDKKLILAGDTVGNCYLLNIEDGKKVWSDNPRLHKDKVSHVEFCPLDSDLFVTASIDHSVQLWDLRMMFSSDKKPNPLVTFHHLKGVNSAHFSPSNRNSLLTTDQHSQIRVYKTPGWTNELIIPHPHRQFQHLTPIKATWHPLEDIIVVGRYPHDEFLKGDTRTIDFIDGSTGEILSKVKSSTGGILSLNSFNIAGDCLASTAGNSVI